MRTSTRMKVVLSSSDNFSTLSMMMPSEGSYLRFRLATSATAASRCCSVAAFSALRLSITLTVCSVSASATDMWSAPGVATVSDAVDMAALLLCYDACQLPWPLDGKKKLHEF